MVICFVNSFFNCVIYWWYLQ